MTHEDVIKNAQYRKGLSIAYFNAINSAIELTKGIEDADTRKKAIVDCRDWLLDEYATYYTNVLENASVNFKPEETIKRLEKATSLVELQNIWVCLSQDERHHEDIIKKKDELKAQYAQA